MKDKLKMFSDLMSCFDDYYEELNDEQLKEMEHKRKRYGVYKKMSQLAREWVCCQDVSNIPALLEYYYEDMVDSIKTSGKGITEGLEEPNEALASFCFSEYAIADSFYSLFKNKAEEDLKHLCERRWGAEDLKKIFEIIYICSKIKGICIFNKRVYSFMLNEILDCTLEKFNKAYEAYSKKKKQFLLDGDIDFFGLGKKQKFQHYSIYDYFMDNEHVRDRIYWDITMSHYNPVHLFKKREIAHILVKITKIKKTVRNMIKQYLNKNNQTYTEQDIINIGNEYTLIVETNKGHDKLCNGLFDLIIRVMNKGDTNVNKHLIYLINIYINTRNNRRIKKQGYIGSLDMYRSRLGIDKTPSALHKLLF